MYDEALVYYPRVVRSGLNEWYTFNGSPSSRIGSAAGTASGSYSAGANRAGESDKATCTTNSSFTFNRTTIGANPFTISAWVKFNVAPAGSNVLFEKGAACTTYSGLRIQQLTTTALNFDHGSCGASPGFLSTNMVAADVWTYFAISYSGGTGKFYLGTYGGNLVTVGTATPAKDYGQHANPFQIFPGANLNACVDDFLNYNRALSFDEIQENFRTVE